MRKELLLFVLFFAAFSGRAQKGDCKVFYPYTTTINRNDTAAIIAYLKTFTDTEQISYQLLLDSKTESPFSTHYTFQQALKNIRFKDAYIKINIAKNGRVISVFSSFKDIEPSEIDEPNETSLQRLNSFAKNYRTKKENIADLKEELIYALTESRLELLLKLTYKEKSGIAKEILFDKNGFFTEKITSVFFDTDSTVTGKVFNPDPLTTAQTLYGSPYIDSSNLDVFALNNQRQTKSFKVHFDGTVFTLKNAFLELQDLNGDGIIPVTSTSPAFDFTRAQNGFEDVNAYYHLSTHRDYIHHLGFALADVFLYADPHGTSDDNSYFTAPNSIYYGTGGVDDAEDADVLIHEYSHFISNNASPNSNIGFERLSLDEAIADYFAASYSKSLNAYNWFWVYNWDGHNEFWNGRIVNSTKHYPEDLSSTSFYRNAELFSSTLMEIHNDLGRSYTDSLTLSLLYFLAPNMTQAQAAETLLHCDTLLSDGAYFCPIYKRLYERGYLAFRENNCGVSAITETQKAEAKLQNTPVGFILLSDNELIISSYEIYNLSGQKIFSSQGSSFEQKENIANGLYLISVSTNRRKIGLKWSNF